MMKTTLLLLIAFLLTIPYSYAQLVPCRPQICMFDYNFHDDSSPNADMTTIKTIKPDILVDNTPGGYWGEYNGGVGCHPIEYTPLGIKVFSYIAGGYEGTLYNNNIDSLALNLARIDAIAADAATGVFLDEVSNYPNTAGKAYIMAIYNKCQSLNLKLILNPGTFNFDPWLMSYCDYILTDEQYNGSRSPSSSEIGFLSRVLVITQNVTDATDAANVSLGARANGFGFSYACTQYITLPSWLNDYMANITQQPATPTISFNGTMLQSDAPFGNQWYEVSQGLIAGATGQTYTPVTDGYYYSIVMLQGCPSDSSNVMHVTTTGIETVNANSVMSLYPNPACERVNISVTKGSGHLAIYNLAGKVVYSEDLEDSGHISLKNLASGIYIVKYWNNSFIAQQKLVVDN